MEDKDEGDEGCSVEDWWQSDGEGGGQTLQGRPQHWPVQEVFLTSQARQSELLCKVVEGNQVVDWSILAKVGCLTTSYNQLKRETEAEQTWLQVKMETPWNQHKYNFIMQVGHILTGTDMDNLVELCKVVGEAIQELKCQGAQVITGN